MGTPEEPFDAHLCAGFAVSILRDNPLLVTSPKDLERDASTILSRTSQEGLAFLTKTLPSLGKAVLSGMREEEFPSGYRGFRLGPEGRPVFMRAYLELCFGVGESPETRARALKHVLQVCFVFYKLRAPYRHSEEQAVLDRFVATEEELSALELGSDARISVASTLVERVFSDFDPKDVTPKHGPGAVATGERLWHKWSFKRLFDQIHQFYPYYDYFMVGSREELLDRSAWYRSLERLHSGTAKVVLVPKDSRGPRLISAEPLEYQYIQQGLSTNIVRKLESHPLTKGHVNFTDQSPNQRLALASSLTGEFATMDLKDASDRVSLALVRMVFSKTPDLLRALEACRTTATILPDGRRVEFHKYAPMGSALCFPVMSVCLWALAVAAIRQLRPLHEALGSVYVYGDDIIVRTEFAELVSRTLEDFGLAVNTAKSYEKGPFRESCGMDAFMGVRVTPLRAKLVPTQRRDGQGYVASVELHNALREAGYVRASEYLLSWTESVYGRVPYGTRESAYPCRWAPNPMLAAWWNLKAGFQVRRVVSTWSWEVRCLVLKAQDALADHDGWERLLQNLLQPARSERWMIRKTSKLVRRWGATGS